MIRLKLRVNAEVHLQIPENDVYWQLPDPAATIEAADTEYTFAANPESGRLL
jgi:hypothetical protein